MDRRRMQNVVINKSTISTAGLLTILLMILKLTHNIDISWFWVFAPYWLPIAIVIGIMLFIVIGGLLLAGIMVAWDAWDDSQRNKRLMNKRNNKK